MTSEARKLNRDTIAGEKRKMLSTIVTTHSFPPAEFEAMYRDTVKRRNKWMSRFVDGSKAAAE